MAAVTLLGINGATIPGADLGTGIRAAARAGFSCFEPRVPRLLECETGGGEDEARRLLEGESLSWLPLNGLEGVFQLDRERLAAAAGEVFSLARRFGVFQVILVPGRREGPELSPERCSGELEWLVDLAGSHGISLLYELLGFSTHALASLDQARAVARSAGIPLVLDTFHLAVSGTSPSQIEMLAPGEIGLVHLSDALSAGKALAEIEDEDRVLPGEGGLPLVEVLASIRRTGYGGPVSVEVFHPRYGERDPFEVALEAHGRALEVLGAAGWDVG